MLPAVVRSIRLIWPASTPPVLFQEVCAPNGVADLVALEFDHVVMKRRKAAGVEPVVERALFDVLFRLTDRPRPIQSLVWERSLSYTRSLLRELERRELAERGEAGHWRSTGRWSPGVAKIVAVELKLRAWQKALHQARWFSRFADLTWVVLDEGGSTAVKDRVSVFTREGIGLAVASKAGGITRVLARPRRSKADPWAAAWVAECCWAALQDAAPAGKERRP